MRYSLLQYPLYGEPMPASLHPKYGLPVVLEDVLELESGDTGAEKEYMCWSEVCGSMRPVMPHPLYSPLLSVGGDDERITSIV